MGTSKQYRDNFDFILRVGMREVDEKDWLVLKALYEEKSITKTSERLYVSQPALTKRIQQIESDFSVEVISRSKKGVTFTSEGEYLVEYAKSMLSILQKTKDNLMNFQSTKVQGTLRIGVSINFAYKNLPGILRGFSETFPQVHTEVVAGYSSEVIKLLQSEQLQVAVVRGDFQWGGPKQHINEENICLISHEKIDINSLPFLPRIGFTTDPLLQNILDKWWRDKFPNSPRIAMEVGNSQIAVEMVTQGLGYAILPRYCLRDEDNLHIEEIHYDTGNPVIRNTWLIYHEKDLVLSTVREFSKFMEKS